MSEEKRDVKMMKGLKTFNAPINRYDEPVECDCGHTHTHIFFCVYLCVSVEFDRKQTSL